MATTMLPYPLEASGVTLMSDATTTTDAYSRPPPLCAGSPSTEVTKEPSVTYEKGRHFSCKRFCPISHKTERHSLPQDMVETYNVVYFWLEVVAQFVIGISGFIANLVVIPILCRCVCTSLTLI